MKYFVEDKQAVWVTFKYEVEAKSTEEASELYEEGDYNYTGFVMGDNVESMHIENTVSVVGKTKEVQK